MHEQIMEMLMKEEEISWQTILHDLIKSEGWDPWDIDVSKLSATYLDVVKRMRELNLPTSGKVVLAAAILLKIKSKKLVQEDIYNLDRMMIMEDEEDEGFEDDDERTYSPFVQHMRENKPVLLPKTPQPRKRKVSVYDLISALQQALEIRKKRALREILDEVPAIQAPEKKEDISLIIERLYTQISKYFDETKDEIPLKFTDLTPSLGKEDLVYTFIPLLQLTNDRKIDLHQEDHFEEIHITRVHLSQEELLRLEKDREDKLRKEEEKRQREEEKKKKARDKKKSSMKKVKRGTMDEDLVEEARDIMSQAVDNFAKAENTGKVSQ